VSACKVWTVCRTSIGAGRLLINDENLNEWDPAHASCGNRPE
jgi:hypothetical protein